MDHATANAHTRDGEAEEQKQDKELELEIEECLQRWKHRAKWLGLALLATIAGVIPFLYGYPLRDYWDTVGKKILVFSMCLLPAFVFSAGNAYVFWRYLRAIKRIHQE